MLEVLSWQMPSLADCSNHCLQEILNLFEVAQMWQIDIVTDAMPGLISSRHWRTEQEQAALADAYARPNLGSNLYEAAILKLIKAAEGDPAVSCGWCLARRLDTSAGF